MLAFSNDYYGFIFRATQSVELFCAYLSSKSEVPIETVLQMADGSVKNPGIFAIAKICEGLNVSLKDFFDTDEFRNIMI